MNARASYMACSVLLLAALARGTAQTPGGDAYRTDAASVARGSQLFDRQCAACHSFETAEIGPTLTGVTALRSKTWLVSFIRDAPGMIAAGDPTAAQLHAKYKQVMPPFPALTADEVEQLLAYLHTFRAAAAKSAPGRTGALTDPIPARIAASGLTIVLRKVLTVPPSGDPPLLTRINKLLAVGRGAGERLFLHDLRGKLYEIDAGTKTPRVYLDAAAALPRFIHVPGLGTGLGSFAFHPEFDRNGLIYTTHTEPARAAAADFPLPAAVPTRLQWVLMEWKADSPSGRVFAGSRRELLRADMYSQIHGFQEVTFNPLAAAGDADYGLLYIAVGDGGAGVTRYWASCCADGVWGTVLRIDPAGRNAANGRYGIPADNPFAAGGGLPREVWARGFRNPHRIAWDATGTRRMLITNIGQGAIEEVNLGTAGAHYGWPHREGTFVMDTAANPNAVYPRPQHEPDAYVDPVAQYDHDEGNAVSGGFVYSGDRIPALRGKYVFGDITRGRVFFAEVSEMAPGRQAAIHELAIEVEGRRTDLATLTGNRRVDLRFGQDSRGELYVFTKPDGVVWQIADCRGEN